MGQPFPATVFHQARAVRSLFLNPRCCSCLVVSKGVLCGLFKHAYENLVSESDVAICLIYHTWRSLSRRRSIVAGSPGLGLEANGLDAWCAIITKAWPPVFNLGLRFQCSEASYLDKGTQAQLLQLRS